MVTNDKIVEYLIQTEMPFEQVQEGMWLVHDENDLIDNIVLIHTPPVITFRVKLMEVSSISDETRLSLYSHLLALNSSEMVAGAYGLEGESVVIIDSLQSENLDFNEFQGSLDSIAMAIREHYSEIRALVPRAVLEEEGFEETPVA
jgi:hypothetical protein